MMNRIIYLFAFTESGYKLHLFIPTGVEMKGGDIRGEHCDSK